MPNIINATSTGSGGLISTGDDSGVLNIQTNETTALSIDASQNVTLTNYLNGTYTGAFVSLKVYTSTGANTWTKPTGLKRIKVTVIGAGGSGGGANTGSSYRGTGGAGGGGSIKVIEASSLGATETATVGAGGASRNTNIAGATGGTSSFGSHCSATGGTGGQAGANGAQAGVAGGSGSSGDINISGGPSVTKGNTGYGNTDFPGTGGVAAFGYGFGGCNVSDAGSAYGGGGACENHTGGGSGAGGNGIIIVEEYF